MPHVYSTTTSSNVYKFWRKGGGDLPVADGEILIAGGANVADKRTLVTPYGVVTSITDDQAEKLRDHPVFKKHMERGYMTIRNDNDKVDVEVAVTNGMSVADGSAPLTENDFAEGKTPIVGSGRSDDVGNVDLSRGRKATTVRKAGTTPPPPKAV